MRKVAYKYFKQNKQIITTALKRVIPDVYVRSALK